MTDYTPEKEPASEVLSIDGVSIRSVHNKADELQVLGDIVGELPAEVRALIDDVLCDCERYSEAPWVIEVTLREWTKERALQVGELFGQKMQAKVGGHNGIWVQSEDFGDRCIEVPACWIGDNAA